MPAGYRLASHVHVCVTEDAAVFMDLRQNAYVGLDEMQSRAMAQLVEGWPCCPSTQLPPRAEGQRLAQSLHERGLLPTGTHGHSARPPLVDKPVAPLIEWDQMTHCVRFIHIARFVLSLLTAAFLMYAAGMERTATRLRTRRKRAGRFDIQRAREIVSVFYQLRPFFYAPKGRCLLDTFVLLEFLYRHGICATWVVGVQTRPFAAHSWAQHESYVLNGTSEYVQLYRPILAV